MSDLQGYWPEWLENTVKVAAVYGASIFLGAALSGINGGIANESKGNSYINGYAGGATGGAIQAACSKTPGGTIAGGTIGVTVGTAITDGLNNIDPDSSNSTVKEMANNAILSGGKAFVTSSITAYTWYSADMACINGCNGLMPTFTYGVAEAYKAFWGWLDDAVVYVWE